MGSTSEQSITITIGRLHDASYASHPFNIRRPRVYPADKTVFLPNTLSNGSTHTVPHHKPQPQYTSYPCPSRLTVSMHLCFLSALPLVSLSVVQTSSPPSIGPPLSSQTILCLAPSSFPPWWRTEPLSGSVNIREAMLFAKLYRSMSGQACECLRMCTMVIHSISGIL